MLLSVKEAYINTENTDSDYKNMGKKIIKRAIKILCILLAVNTVFVFTVGGVIYGGALKRHGASVTASDGDKNWLERVSTELYTASEDGLRLHGYYAENPDGKNRIALVCHGYDGNGAGMTYYAKRFYDMGYSVLAPDARSHGMSDGEIIGMGYIEKRDIIGWINLITKDKPDAEVVLFGLSMGAGTVLFTSGEADLPRCVRAVVSDCAYTDVYNEIGSAVRYAVPWAPSFPVVDCASFLCQLDGGYDFRAASCVDAVKRSVTPTLFIHGSEDRYVPFEMMEKLYLGCSAKKEKLVIEGAEHANSAGTDGELYWITVERFLSEYIK